MNRVKGTARLVPAVRTKRSGPTGALSLDDTAVDSTLLAAVVDTLLARVTATVIPALGVVVTSKTVELTAVVVMGRVVDAATEVVATALDVYALVLLWATLVLCASLVLCTTVVSAWVEVKGSVASPSEAPQQLLSIVEN